MIKSIRKWNCEKKQLRKIYETHLSIDSSKALRKYKKQPNITLKLFGNNKEIMKKAFSKQDFCYTTWYKGWIWFLEYGKYRYSITCSIRGTEIRQYYLSESNPKEIVEFIKKLIEKLNL